jgi:hypothetical protein
VRDHAGNESAVVSETLAISDPFAAVAPPVSPLPSSPLQPDGFGLSLNNGLLFTNIPTVTVTAWGPNVTEVRFGDSSVDTGDNWQTYPVTLTRIISTGDYFTPYRVYGWFRNLEGLLYGPYFDDLIYDPIPPQGWVAIADSTGLTVTLSLSAWDDNSGLGEMRLGSFSTVTQTAWQPYALSALYPAGEPVIYAQFRDRAGNLSPIYGSDGSDSSMTERVYLPLIQR